MNYESFSVEALVADEAFQTWVLAPTAESSRFWDDFLEAHPAQRADLAEARRLVQHWRQVRQADYPADEVAGLREAIFARIQSEAETPVVPLHRPWWQGRRLTGIAAACAVLLLAFGYFWLNRSAGWVVEETPYGQTRTLTLPDGSTVTLNAHSTLRFAKNLADHSHREVFLTGEAFFSVRHTSDHRPFRVNTGRIAVDVLGTEFNVSDRRNVARVVLESGKVRVQLDGDSAAHATLKPGDLVELQPGAVRLAQRRVQPGTFSTWRQHRWKLQREPLADVAQRLEEIFGIRVVFANDADRQRPVSGEVPTHDLQALCDILGETLGLRFVRSGNEVRVE